MISQSGTVGSVDGTASYLSYGKAENNNKVEDREKRVAWESGRNLRGARSIKEAKRRFRQAAARKARTVEKPYYQVIVSWQSGNEEKGIPPDDPTREEMEEVVDRTLSELDLEEHQAWVVAHHDTSTTHVHVVVGRVHPRTGETWSPSYDQTTLYHTLREIEEEQGWHRPGPMNIKDLSGDEREGPEYWEKQAEKFGRERSVRRWAREEGIPELLKEARSWEQAEKVLQGTGATLKPRRERGMVIERDGGHAALSSIDPLISRPKLEKRYGQSWEDYKEERQSAEERLSEKLPGRADPSEGQLRAYRLMERIEALREIAGSLEDEDRLKDSKLGPQKKEARLKMIETIGDIRDSRRGSEEIEDLGDQLRFRDEKSKILENAKFAAQHSEEAPRWATGMELSESQKNLLSETINVRTRVGLTEMDDQKVEELIEYARARERVMCEVFGEEYPGADRWRLEKEWSKVEDRPDEETLSDAQRRALHWVYNLDGKWGPGPEDSKSKLVREEPRTDDRAYPRGPLGELRKALTEMSERETEQLKAHLEGEDHRQKILESQRGPAERAAKQKRMMEKAGEVVEEGTRHVKEHLDSGNHRRAAKLLVEKTAEIRRIRAEAPDGDKIGGLRERLDEVLNEDLTNELYDRGQHELRNKSERIERGDQRAFKALSTFQKKVADLSQTLGRQKETNVEEDLVERNAEVLANHLAKIERQGREEVAGVLGEEGQKAFADALKKAKARGAEQRKSSEQGQSEDETGDHEQERSRSRSRGRGR